MKAGDEIMPEPRPFLTIKRIAQEEIICQGEKSQQLLQSVVCPVCLMVLPMPHYSCDSCDNAFCIACIENWWKKNPNSCIFKCSDSHFKMIKRSNTYNALMEILKAKCKYCNSPIPILQLETHDKICLRKPIICNYEGCGKVYPKGEMDDHLNICEFLRVQCAYCKQQFFKKVIQSHQNNQCEVRQVVCKYKQCGSLVKIKDIADHLERCLFKPQNCDWCKQSIFLKDKEPHERNCPFRLIKCTWCESSFKPDLIDVHKTQCPKRKFTCQLCKHEILYTEFKDHKLECMFKNMLIMRQSQAQLIQQNVKLKQKVHQLEFQLQQAIRQNQESAFNAMIRVKEQEKHQYEKDILRLNNGIANIQKLRNAEMAEHLKKPHLSSSLCPFCIAIRSKLQQDLAPLLRQKDQVTAKMMDVQRLRLATVSSKVKMSRIRE